MKVVDGLQWLKNRVRNYRVSDVEVIPERRLKEGGFSLHIIIIGSSR